MSSGWQYRNKGRMPWITHVTDDPDAPFREILIEMPDGGFSNSSLAHRSADNLVAILQIVAVDGNIPTPDQALTALLLHRALGRL